MKIKKTCYLKRIWLNLLVISFACNLAFAAPKPIELTLHDAILLAMRLNPNVQNAGLQRVIDRINLSAANWQYAVQYSLTGSANYAKNISDGQKTSEFDAQNIVPQAQLLTPIGTVFNLQMANNLNHIAGNARYYNPAIKFSLTQPLLRGAGRDVVLAPLHLAENQEIIQQLAYKNVLMQSITDVISAWLSLIQLQNSLEVQKLALQNSKDTLQQQKAFWRAGRIAKTDLVQFRATVANQELLLAQQIISIGQQKRALLIALGLNPDLSIKISNSLPPNNKLPTLAASIQAALINNIGYQQAKLTLKQAEINLLTAKDNARWQLDLTASHTEGGGSGGAPNSGFNSLANGRNRSSEVGLTLNIPIDNLQLKQAVVQAGVGLQQQKITLQENQRELTSAVINTWNMVNSQKQQIEQAHQSVMLARDSLNIAQTKLKFGKVTPFEVSTLQTNLTQQEISEINVKISYVSNLAQLDQITGNTLTRWDLKISPLMGIKDI